MSTNPVPQRAFPAPPMSEQIPDLRRHRRYPIALELHYTSNHGSKEDHTGSGVTLNISSGGILFRGSERLAERSRIEIALNWPFALEDCALKLVMRGRVVRSENHITAVRIQQYEFRTAGPRHIGGKLT